MHPCCTNVLSTPMGSLLTLHSYFHASLMISPDFHQMIGTNMGNQAQIDTAFLKVGKLFCKQCLFLPQKLCMKVGERRRVVRRSLVITTGKRDGLD